MKKGDMVMTSVELFVRLDGSTFMRSEFPDIKKLKSEFKNGADVCKKGTMCMIESIDGEFFTVRKDHFGRKLIVRAPQIEFITEMDNNPYEENEVQDIE